MIFDLVHAVNAVIMMTEVREPAYRLEPMVFVIPEAVGMPSCGAEMAAMLLGLVFQLNSVATWFGFHRNSDAFNESNDFL